MTRTDRPFLLICQALLILATVFYAMGAIRLNTNLQAGDQGAYLHLSLRQKAGLQLTDGNRHPLYSALLLPLAESHPRFFARARWVSFALGVLFVAGMACHETLKRRSALAGTLILLFFSLHAQMVRTLSEIWCEPLLYLLVYLLWRELDEWGKETAHDLTSHRFLLGSGVLTGLVYLSKGTGLQVAALFWIAVFSFAKRKTKPLIGVAAFLVVSSPLLVWNTLVYHNPVYSFASTHNMWFDEADEIWYDDPADLPTLGRYLRTHSAGEILGRLGRGLILESGMVLQLFWKDWKLPEGSASLPEHLLLGFKTLAALGIGWVFLRSLRRRKNLEPICSRPAALFFFLMVLVMVPSFGWYAQLTHAPRFLMTLVPIAIVLSARLVSQFLEEVGRSQGRGFKLMAGVLFVYSSFAMIQTASFAWKTRVVPEPSLDRLAGRILEEVNRLPPDSKIAFGPSHGLPLWLSRADLRWRPTPWRIDFERFTRMLERESIPYVLIDGETLARRPYLNRLVTPAFIETLGWRVLARFRTQEGFFILFQVPERDIRKGS